jgi:hypothetical protein
VLGYRRKSFKRAHTLLTELREAPENLEVLLALQYLLIEERRKAEEKIRSLKKELKELEKASSKTDPPKRVAYLQQRIERVRSVNYAWRCFGDAIAFLYMDKFALKQTHYSTHSVSVKQDAGFLSDKAGLAAELEYLKNALETGIPSLLVDLTDTIRHGDVCHMVGADPILVEVKAGGKLDQRGKKQAKSLEQLNKFFETDHAVGLRGLPEIRRVEHAGSDQSYIDELNACITAAFENGAAIVHPEPGIYYAAIVEGGAPMREVLGQLDVKQPHVYYLNDRKSMRDWAPYYPFTLSIYAEEHLFDFLQGNLILLAIVDFAVLCEIAAEKGYTAQFDPEDPNYPFIFTKDRPNSGGRISQHILSRVALEFTSPRWIINAGIDGYERNIERASSEVAGPAEE